MKTELLNQNEFVDIVVEKIKQALPKGTNITKESDMNFIVKNDTLEGTVSLENVWQIYQSNGDKNTISDFVTKVSAAFQQTKQLHAHDLKQNKHLLFPSVRSVDFVNSLQSQNEISVRILSEDLLGNLKKVYFLWQEGYSIPLNDTLLKVSEGITEEEIHIHAKENIMKQGWIPHQEAGDLRAGTFYMFNEGRLLFHSQFFIQEWIEEHLGSEFYFSFPNKDMALVFVPNQKAKREHVLFDRQFLLDNTLMDYQSPYPISKNIFSYRNGEYNVVL